MVYYSSRSAEESYVDSIAAVSASSVSNASVMQPAKAVSSEAYSE